MKADGDILITLAVQFAIMSLLALGGANAVVPEMHRQAVDVHLWISDRKFSELFAIAQAAPGPNVLVTALIGWKIAGIAGGMVTFGAFCGPAAVLAYAIGGIWDRMRDAPWRKVFQRALVPISVGFIVSGGYVLATPRGVDWQSALIAGLSAAVLYATRVNPLWVLAGGGALGFLLF